uniref:THH1/TOM1/TOM3 domain-containing protein n=1 Tax=Cucumis melo TaxID=3656 RepID=A0A9I9DLL1_CUCME
MGRLQLNLTTTMEMGVTETSWWNDINESTFWQDRIFYSLCAVYALVSAVALVSLFCFRTPSI